MNDLKNKQDIPLPIAISLLLVVLVLVGYQIPQTKDLFELVIQLSNSLALTMILGMLAVSINVSWILSILIKLFGYKKQGSRLKKLTGIKNTINPKDIRRTLVSVTVTAICFFPLKQYLTTQLDKVLATEEYLPILLSHMTMSIYIIGLYMLRLPIFKLILDFNLKTLSRFPKIKNSIVLGTVNER